MVNADTNTFELGYSMQTQQAYKAVINDFNYYYLNISTKFGLYLNIPFFERVLL